MVKAYFIIMDCANNHIRLETKSLKTGCNKKLLLKRNMF